MIVFLNGKLLSEKKASVSILDHGFLYGDGVYETIRVYAGRPFLLQEHLRRLNRSLHGIRLAPPYPLIDIGRAIQKVVSINRHKEAVVRVTLTRGPGPYGFDPRPLSRPTVVITSSPIVPYPPQDYKGGITAAVVSIRRNSPRSLPPEIKSTSCLNNILAKMEATDLEAREAIMLTQENYVAEGTISNIFLVKGKKTVVTPRLEGFCLPGVTRSWVCRMAEEAGYAVEERRVGVSELGAAQEIFLTSTIMEIMPVSHVVVAMGGAHVPFPLVSRGGKTWKVGRVTKDLMKRFKKSIISLRRR